MSDERDKKDDKESGKRSESPEDADGSKSPSQSVDRVGSSVGTVEEKPSKDRKGKVLRFTLPEWSRIEEAGPADDRSYQEEEIQNVLGIRVSPLPFPKSSTVSDVMRAMHVDVTEEESESSIYLETESRVTLPPAFAYKPLFDALRRSPTKSQVDYNLLMSTVLRNLEGVMQAVEQGANVNVVQDKKTPLIIAAENNDKQIVTYLLTVENIDLDRQNIYGQTALLIALRSGFEEIVSMLVEKKANVHIPDYFGKTPLHEAVFQENMKMVQLVLQKKKQIEMMDCFGEKPIYTCSVKKPNLELLKFLLKSGASCEYTNVTGLSLLSRAILNSTSFSVISCLVEAGADVNHEDHFCRRTPLHMATIVNSLPIVKLLIENGADANLKTINGLTPFDLSLYYRCLDISEYLASYTTESALNADNFRDSLLSRLPNNTSALFLLRAQAGRPTVGYKNSLI